MTASPGISRRCLFDFLTSVGIAGLIVLAIGPPQTQQHGERSSSDAAALAVALHTRNHIAVGEPKGTQRSDSGSLSTALTPPRHKVLIVYEAFPHISDFVVSFFDRQSYYTTGPPLQTARLFTP